MMKNPEENFVGEPSYGIGRPAMNQGYNASFSFQIEEEVEPTLVAAGASGVAHPRFSSSKASFFTEANEECANTLVATDYKDPPIVNDGEDTDYIVRRLTPTECARLQGFPDWWCDELGIAEPTDSDIAKWREIFNAHAKAMGKTTKPKSDNQIRKWLFCTEAALEKCPELAGLPGEHYLVEDHVADKLADVGTHQGVFGIFRTPVHTLDEAKTGGRYLALERVQDPGNVGTLLRSAAAFGFDGVLLSDGCASVFAPKTLRASMGAAVRVPVMEVGAMPAAIAALRAKNITCLAAALYQSQPLSAARPGYPGGLPRLFLLYFIPAI